MVDLFADERFSSRNTRFVKSGEGFATQEGIREYHSAVIIHEFGHTHLPQLRFHRFGDGGEVDIPRRNEFTKCVVVNQTNVEIVATMVNDGFYSEMDIGLVEVVAGTRLETLPSSGVVFVFGMNPDFGSVESIYRRIVEQIVFD